FLLNRTTARHTSGSSRLGLFPRTSLPHLLVIPRRQRGGNWGGGDCRAFARSCRRCSFRLAPGYCAYTDGVPCVAGGRGLSLRLANHNDTSALLAPSANAYVILHGGRHAGLCAASRQHSATRPRKGKSYQGLAGISAAHEVDT